MAGNVKEWCLNSAGEGKRYVLGGAYDEREYMFGALDIRSAFDRARNCGFRCVKYLPGKGPPQASLREQKRSRGPDFLKKKIMTDEEFEFVRRQYAYDKRDVRAQVIREEVTTNWVRERVEYEAAYGKEQAITYLFLPRRHHPPYQPVIYWPGAYASTAKAITPADVESVAFLVKSGRALVWPIYKGTYERQVGPARGAAEQWELWKQCTNDLRRAIDYVETRSDLNAAAIGYYGVSGGANGVLAIEDRVKAAVFVDGGMWIFNKAARPELDMVHYLPRIRIPVLMLNGEYDSFFSPVESQEPMFQLLGTSPEHKKRRLFKSSHIAIPMNDRIQETVNWFDRYLGPATPQ
jgi:pimeloyl-ACP methyl ester carboxylesterase